ncbi:hypothetical protein PIB30_114341, partial [Stylosanthes scabra]|nr:hypothetical protein [Stylosanthes scabra]
AVHLASNSSAVGSCCCKGSGVLHWSPTSRLSSFVGWAEDPGPPRFMLNNTSVITASGESVRSLAAHPSASGCSHSRRVKEQGSGPSGKGSSLSGLIQQKTRIYRPTRNGNVNK